MYKEKHCGFYLPTFFIQIKSIHVDFLEAVVKRSFGGAIPFANIFLTLLCDL